MDAIGGHALMAVMGGGIGVGRNWRGSDFGIGLVFSFVEFGGEHGYEA